MNSRKLYLVLIIFVFSIFINLFFIGNSKADPLTIKGSNPNPNQMSTGGNQTLTAANGSGPYTWTINGAPASTTSNTLNYQAPLTNPNCENNPIICVTDNSNGQSTCMSIAVNAYTGNGVAYRELPCGVTGACGWTDKYTEYQCTGSMNPVQGYCPATSGAPTCHYWGAEGKPYTYSYPGYIWGVPLRLGDVRSAEMKAAGCCSPQTLPPITQPPPPSAPPTNSSGNSCTSVPSESSANLKSGNLYHSQNVAGLTLSYNSIDNINGALGNKWTHNYNQQLITSSGGNTLILRTEDDNYINFNLSGSIYYPDAISGDTSSIVKNTDSSFTRTTKTNTTYNYNSAGNLISIVDNNGNTTALTYSGSNLASITDQNGRTTTITSTGSYITGITDAAGHTYTLAYAGSLLTSVTDPLGNSWLYTYDANGRMLSKKDPANFTVTYTYDGNGRILTSTDPEGKTRTMNYTQSSSTTFTEKDGGLWSYTYDPTYTVKTSMTDPLGNTTSYAYDANRNLTKTTYPDATSTSYTYDTNSNRISVTDALGNKTTYTYNSQNLVTSITDATGKITQYAYDAKGNILSTTDPSGAVTQYTYDNKGNILSVTSPNGGVTRMVYDQNNNLIAVTDPSGATTAQSYDRFGNISSSTDPLGNTTKYQYNTLNQLIAVTDASGKTTQYTYDAKGNKLTATDADGNTTRYTYNYKNQLIQTIDALGNTTTFTYGGAGCASCGGGTDKLTVVTDAKNQTTSYQYDQTGRLIKETDPLGNYTNYAYDAKGNMLSKTKPDGRTINYIYDALNRLVKRTYPNNTSDVFQYDQTGNVITATTNQNIAYYYSYDASNRITGITDSNLHNIEYQYDVMGNRTMMITPEGKIIKYVYSQNNQVTKITADSGNYTFTYDSANRRIKRTLPNDTFTTYSYDQLSRLTNITHKNAFNKIIDTFSYTYDNIGNKITKTDDDKTLSYNYDQIYRLMKATPQSNNKKDKLPEETIKLNTEAYSYDPVGNRQTGPKTDNSYSYNYGNELINDKNNQYVYDVNGNLIKKTEASHSDHQATITTYTYDDENRLTDVKIQRGNKVKEISFTYDPFGRRISKTINKEDFDDDHDKDNDRDGDRDKDRDRDKNEQNKHDYPKTTYYVYDNQNIIAEYDEKGKLIASYVHGPNTDEPLSAEIHNDRIYYHADGLGSITALTNHMGNAIQRYGYDSFGNIKHNPHPRWITQPYTYTAREYDTETGMYFYRARYYDPKAGRFISKDPIGFKSGDVNFYRYVNNNPIRFVDSFGLKAGDVCTNIVIKRKNINKTGEDKYGHWWTEIGGNESYGWWPKNPVGISGTIFGVPGELNGQTLSKGKGTPTTDAHHGDPAEEVFNPRISSSEDCKCKTCDEAANCVRNFANSYSGSWSWPFGQNCHSFQESAMSSCCLER